MKKMSIVMVFRMKMKSGLHILLFSNFNRTDTHFSVPFLLFSNFNKTDIRTVLMVPNTRKSYFECSCGVEHEWITYIIEKTPTICSINFLGRRFLASYA